MQMVAQHHQPAGIGEWERTEKNAFNNGEDGRGGADAKREREHRSHRKSGRLAQLTECIAEIVEKSGHRKSPYSERNACMGSMEAARRAGMVQASSATAIKIADTPM